MTDDRPDLDPLDHLLTGALRQRAAEYVLPADGLDQIHAAVTRRHRRQRTTWLAAAAVLLVLVGMAAWVLRPNDDTSSPFVGPTATTVPDGVEEPDTNLPPDTGVSTAGSCVTSSGAPIPALVGDAGVESAAELVSVVWREVAGDLPLLGISASPVECAVTATTPAGDLTVSTVRTEAGWQIQYVSPIEQDPDEHLSVQWLTNGTLQVFSDRTCPSCASVEVTAFADGRSTQTRSGLPLAVEMQAPEPDGARALLLRYLDAGGAVQRVFLIPIPAGDFAAG